MSMQGLHGVTSKTAERMVFDVGVIYKGIGLTALRGEGEGEGEGEGTALEQALAGATKLGATRGGAVFEVEREITEGEVDGARGPIKGLRRVIREVATLSATVVEIYDETLKLALGGTTTKTGAKDVTEYVIGEIEDSDYFGNLALLAKKKGTGKFFLVGVTEALNDQGISLSFEDKTELGLPLRAVGHFDPEAMTERPFFIFDIGAADAGEGEGEN